MSEGTNLPDDIEKLDDDVKRLHAFGYGQELARRLGGFSNFALSLSIICILAGGVTSFHLGLCSVGGASIGLAWPLVVGMLYRRRSRSPRSWSMRFHQFWIAGPQQTTCTNHSDLLDHPVGAGE